MNDIQQLNDTPVPLHITFRGVIPTEDAERAIRDRVTTLAGPRGRVVRVLIERDRPRRGRQRPPRFEQACRAQLVIALPSGKHVSVRCRAHAQPLAAIAEVFGVARRLLRQRPSPRLPVLALEVAC